VPWRVGDLTSIQGFDLSGGKQNAPTLIMKAGRNLQVTDAGTNAVVLASELQFAPANLRIGDTVVVQSADGSITKLLRVVGFFDSSTPTGNTNFANMLADSQIVQQLGGSQTLEVFSLKVDADHVPALRKSLLQAAPSAIILSVVDVDTFVNQLLNNLVIMLTTIASLAMVAGLIIIANAVALGMLERRLDNVAYSLGFASSRAQARKFVRHGHVLVANRHAEAIQVDPQMLPPPGPARTRLWRRPNKPFWAGVQHHCRGAPKSCSGFARCSRRIAAR